MNVVKYSALVTNWTIAQMYEFEQEFIWRYKSSALILFDILN